MRLVSGTQLGPTEGLGDAEGKENFQIGAKAVVTRQKSVLPTVLPICCAVGHMEKGEDYSTYIYGNRYRKRGVGVCVGAHSNECRLDIVGSEEEGRGRSRKTDQKIKVPRVVNGLCDSLPIVDCTRLVM